MSNASYTVTLNVLPRSLLLLVGSTTRVLLDGFVIRSLGRWSEDGENEGKRAKQPTPSTTSPPPSDRAKPRGMRCQCALQRAPPGCVRVSLCACAPPGGSAYAGVANQEWLSKGEIESKWVGVVAVFRLKPSRAILTKHV